MAKLTLFLAIFTLFLLAANASIYRATVVIDEDQSCQQQIQQQQNLRQCQMYLWEQVRGQQEGEGGGSRDNQQQFFRQCCQQLFQLDSKCRCQGLEQAVRRQQQQGQLEGQEMRQAYEIASDLPRRCNIPPRQGCGISRYL